MGPKNHHVDVLAQKPEKITHIVVGKGTQQDEQGVHAKRVRTHARTHARTRTFSLSQRRGMCTRQSTHTRALTLSHTQHEEGVTTRQSVV